MSQFINGGGADCGPTSALKNVGNQLERDYGVQRDRFGAQPQAGPSAGPSAFRTRPGQPQQGPIQQSQPSFDLSQLRSHLPAGQANAPGPGPLHAAHQHPHQAGQWADGFSAGAKGKARAEHGVSSWGGEFDSSRQASPMSHEAQINRTASPTVAPWQRPGFAQQPSYAMQPNYAMQQPMFHQSPMMHHHQQPTHMSGPPPQMAVPQPPVQQQQQQQPQAPVAEEQQRQEPPAQVPDDQLARTAQALVDQLDKESMSNNSKLADSQFVKLLRGLGDGSVVVKDGTGAVKEGTEVGDGARFVSTAGGDWASDFVTSGEGAPLEGTVTPNYEAALTMNDGAPVQRRKSVHFDEPTVGVPRNLEEALQSATAVPGVGQSWEGDAMDEEEFDDEAFIQFNGPRVAEPTTAGPTAQETWGIDQSEMERYEQYFADKSDQPYLFHRANPYALGAPIVREMSPTTMGVLELEAAVQQDPRDADAWLALGLKQQENEREEAAIRALYRATQIKPEIREAWLALAVSYTNEGKDDLAHSSLERWIELTDGPNARPISEAMGETRHERQARIVERLIDIARMSPDDLDVDVQVALGVLFNASEDYHKAEDCFEAALEARPDDWVLYNRLGATLANSGRSHEAIKYYHRALALHPNFVRAQFNLGISYINLAQYRLAAQCVLDAIRLQHADVTEGYGAASASSDTKGVTSDALWTTLRMACLHLQRPDLVTFANHHDLSGFPLEL